MFEQDGQVEGWIHYCCRPQDNYLDLCTCNVRTGTRTALEEFLIYAREHFSGHELYLGFPKCNVEAISLLQESSFDCIEEQKIGYAPFMRDSENKLSIMKGAYQCNTQGFLFVLLTE